MGFCLAVVAVQLSRLPIPSRRLRLWLFRDLFVRKYPPGLNEQEAEKPLDAYRSFNALFTRGVKPEHRPIPVGSPEVVSPCDGTVQDVGRVERAPLDGQGDRILAGSMLAGLDPAPFDGGQFAIIFLSPVDCHRVFSPDDGWLDEVVHVPGARLLVHPPFQSERFPVYTLNERMIFRIAASGFVSISDGRRLGGGKHHSAPGPVISAGLEASRVVAVEFATAGQSAGTG